ncbi:protein artichoke-like [Lytechinus variegatus]|uniref:protein artichoke-like n=1 Tax=Lytechinus variegatus TaxID=7654 RepID=UPI001BB18301|nr:protein artichoke-like [Lytechinus variegatus]
MYIFIFLLTLYGRGCNSQCQDPCHCEQQGVNFKMICTDHYLEDVPKDLPCHVGVLNLRRNFITTLNRESFPCQNRLRELLLSNNHLRYIEKQVFDDTGELMLIELHSNFLQSIPYLGSLPIILQISVMRNSLTDWHHQTLQNKTHLTELELAYNKLTNPPKIPFKLSILNLKGNAINDLHTMMLAYPNAISHLNINYNNIEYLDRLQTMKSLKILMLEFNYIRRIRDNVFSSVPLLETIKLGHNNIVDISSFCNMMYIRHIFLEENNIRVVQRPAFTNIPNIDTINLKGNEIIQLSQSFFSTPQSLLLRKNSLTRFELFEGGNYTKLRILNVDRNDLQNISISSYPNLYYLCASFNKIKDVNFGIDSHHQLQYINLNSNQIKNMNKFGNLPNLKWLQLSSNSITSLDDKTLICLPQLRELRLDNNRISILSNLLTCPELTNLQLSENIIHTIENSTFDSSPRLAILNLAKNEISDLRFLHSIYSLEELNLSHNRLRTINPLDFLTLTHLRTLDLSFNLFMEINTPNLQSLQSLDISHNFLYHLNLNHLFGDRTLVKINAEGNRITDVVSTSALDINVNDNAFGASNSSELSGTNILACNNNLSDFKTIKISPNLVGLYLNKNHIVSIPNFTFISASSLIFLELNDNNIADIYPTAFYGLRKVVALKLERNCITHLRSDLFSNILDLKYVRLGGNPLLHVSNHLFPASQDIEGISFPSIPFSNTSLSIFQDIPNLHYLELHENLAFRAHFVRNTSNLVGTILEFSDLWFLNLSSINLGDHCQNVLINTVKILDLSNNAITTIPKYCLPRSKKTYSLYLSQNKLKWILNDSFDKHQQFWFLDLSYNHILFFEFGSLRHQTYLTDLHLQGNQLTKLDLGLLTFPLKSIQIELENNPWTCNCDLIKSVSALKHTLTPIKCDKPLAYANYSVADLAAKNSFTCRPLLCSQPYQTLLSFLGDKMVELPCPIITSNDIYWSVTFQGEQLNTVRDTLPESISILPHNALLISDVTKDMIGLYTCWSRNEGGQTKFKIDLLVEEMEENVEDSYNTTSTTISAKEWKDTLQCGTNNSSNSSMPTFNVISNSCYVLFVSILAFFFL